MKEKESEIQKAILEYLKYKNIFCWRNQTVGIYDPVQKFYRKNSSGLNGVSDILGILPSGRFLAIEVKRKGGKPTEAQQEFIDNINRNLGIAFVATSIDDVERVLQKVANNSYTTVGSTTSAPPTKLKIEP